VKLDLQYRLISALRKSHNAYYWSILEASIDDPCFSTPPPIPRKKITVSSSLSSSALSSSALQHLSPNETLFVRDKNSSTNLASRVAKSGRPELKIESRPEASGSEAVEFNQHPQQRLHRSTYKRRASIDVRPTPLKLQKLSSDTMLTREMKMSRIRLDLEVEAPDVTIVIDNRELRA